MQKKRAARNTPGSAQGRRGRVSIEQEGKSAVKSVQTRRDSWPREEGRGMVGTSETYGLRGDGERGSEGWNERDTVVWWQIEMDGERSRRLEWG